MNKFYKSMLIGLTVIGLGGASFARADDAKDGHGPMGMHEGHAATPERMQARFTKHMTALHDKLTLGRAQEAAWTTFVAAMTPPSTPRSTPAQTRAEMDKLTAPERMDKMLAMLKDHETRLTAHIAAVKTFYAVLSADQQKIFNDNFGKGHMMKGMKHHD